MNQTVLVTTSPRFREVVSDLLAHGQLDARYVRWIHVETEGGEDAQGEQEHCSVVSVDSALLQDHVTGSDPELRKLEARVAGMIRSDLFKSEASLERIGDAERGSFGYVAILGTLFEHKSNLASILALRAALAVSRLLSGVPSVRVDLLGLIPSGAHDDEALSVCLDMIKAISPLHRSRTSVDPWFAFRLLMGVEDAATDTAEEVASHKAVLSEAVATMVEQIEHIEHQQLSVGAAPEGHHLGLFGFADVGFRPGDLLGALASAGGPDFRHLFQLQPLPTDENTIEDLKEEWSAWREELEAALEPLLDAHMAEGFRVPDLSGSEPPSADLDVEAFEQSLLVYVSKLKRQTHEGLRDNFKPLARQAAERFEKWIQRHWDQLVEARRHSIAVAETFGLGLREGPVGQIVRDGVVPAQKKTAMRVCRGDGIGPIDDKVEDPVIREVFKSNADPSSIMSLILESEDPAVRIRMRYMQTSPVDDYGDEEEGIAWMTDCLAAFPDELKVEYDRIKEKLETADKELEEARSEPVRFFKRGEHKERVAELVGNKEQVARGIQQTIVAIAEVHDEQVRRCYGRARWLGAWRSLRRRLERLSNEITAAATNIRDAFDEAYDETSEGLARAPRQLSLGEDLLSTARYACERLEELVEDVSRRMEADGAVVLSGRRMRAYAERPIDTIAELLPGEIAAELPWTLSEAVLKPDEDRAPAFLFDILGKLCEAATHDAKVNPAAIEDSWIPLVLPYLTCEGGTEGPIAAVMDRHAVPPFFPGLSTRDNGWSLLPGEQDLLELRFACLALSPSHLARYEQMCRFADQHKRLSAELTPDAVAHGAVYEAWIEDKVPSERDAEA